MVKIAGNETFTSATVLPSILLYHTCYIALCLTFTICNLGYSDICIGGILFLHFHLGCLSSAPRRELLNLVCDHGCYLLTVCCWLRRHSPRSLIR